MSHGDKLTDTCSRANTLESCREVERLPHCHLRHMQVILAYISRCLRRHKLIQVHAIVLDVSCHLCNAYTCTIDALDEIVLGIE